MLDETVQAAILQLQAQLASSIGQMKDMARRRTEPADPGKLGGLAAQAAQVQSAIQVLQQLREDLVETGEHALRISQEDLEQQVEESSEVIDESALEARRSVDRVTAEEEQSES